MSQPIRPVHAGLCRYASSLTVVVVAVLIAGSSTSARSASLSGPGRHAAGVGASLNEVSEPNDTQTTASDMQLGVAVEAYLPTYADIDWYRFVIHRDTHLRVRLDVPAGTNYDVELYGADATLLRGGYEPGLGYAEDLLTTVPSGTYYVKIKSAGTASESLPYRLLTTVSTFNDPFEPNNSRASAATFGTFPYDAKMFTPDDEDWYRFNVTGWGMFGLQLTLPYAMDLRLAIYNSAGELLDEVNTGADLDATILRITFEPAEYVVRVTSNSGWSPYWNYRLSLSGGVVADPVVPNLVLGLGEQAQNGGWFAVHGGGENSFAPSAWGRLPWPAYNAQGGGVRLATGDVDGDAGDEIVVGLGPQGSGYLAVLDDAAHGYALLAWLQLDWPAYNTANGETFPAVGDIDGDGLAEIVVGLGDGGKGWYLIFDDALQQFRRVTWKQVPWPQYAAGSGATHPAVGDVDGDGVSEIVVGLGRGSGGWLQVVNSHITDFSHRRWVQIDWPSYVVANGTTFPALGDLDDDGRAELLVGLGKGSAGWFRMFDDDTSDFSPVMWDQVDWPAYNAHNGETHPAVGNIDGDPAAEVILGLGEFPGNGGWFEIRDYIAGQVFSGWRSVGWPAFTANGGGMFPAVAARR